MIQFFEVITLGLILSADSFSAAIAMGSRPFSRKEAARFALLSGGAEGLVALIGAMAGLHLIARIKAFDHWIAFILLLAVAIHMIYEALHDLISKKEKPAQTNFHSFTKIIIVSFATSLDAFGVGISLGIINQPILPYIISIALFAFIATLAGLYLAKSFFKNFGCYFSIAGAIILVIMAFKMLSI